MFQPDYTQIERAARNLKAERMPLYEHIISIEMMEKILGRAFGALFQGTRRDKQEFFTQYCLFFKEMGYDTISYEQCIGAVMPGSGALGGHIPGVIRNRGDFERYPWQDVPGLFTERHDENFDILREVMPDGMRAIGGPGNGVFECVQDLVGYMNLCYISADDPQLYADLFQAVGDAMYQIWESFLSKYSDLYCICRFGDDLGFKSSTLLPPEDIKKFVIPQYKRIVDLIHNYGKPFLFHSCGNIFDVMDDMIDYAGINAKHSNEDQIAPFQVWIERYSQRISLFGGIDTDHLCRMKEQEIKAFTKDIIRKAQDARGFALGSGNSIPAYVPVEGYIAMIEAAREARGA